MEQIDNNIGQISKFEGEVVSETRICEGEHALSYRSMLLCSRANDGAGRVLGTQLLPRSSWVTMPSYDCNVFDPTRLRRARWYEFWWTDDEGGGIQVSVSRFNVLPAYNSIPMKAQCA